MPGIPSPHVPGTACSHCGSDCSVFEDIMRYYCVDCGWWGPSGDKILYPNDNHVPYNATGQILPKKHI